MPRLTLPPLSGIPLASAEFIPTPAKPLRDALAEVERLARDQREATLALRALREGARAVQVEDRRRYAQALRANPAASEQDAGVQRPTHEEAERAARNRVEALAEALEAAQRDMRGALAKARPQVVQRVQTALVTERDAALTDLDTLAGRLERLTELRGVARWASNGVGGSAGQLVLTDARGHAESLGSALAVIRGVIANLEPGAGPGSADEAADDDVA